MKFPISIFIITVFFSFSAYAQKEKGKILNAPKIPKNNTKPTTTQKDVKDKTNDEFDFTFEDEPKLRFSNQYENSNNNKVSNTENTSSKGLEGIKIEPLRELNQIVHEDTSTIDEGELLVVEIEEDAQFQGADKMVEIASYYSVWDTKSLNPYGLNPKEFEENP